MTLYLSKAYIHADICPYTRFPTDRQKMHSLIYSMFGKFDEGGRVLWSDETERMCRRMTSPFAGKIVLILSSQQPQVPADAESWCQLEVSTVKPSFLQHPFYAFTLQANCSFLEKNSKTVRPIKDPAKLQQWLARQLQRGGCTLLPDSCEITKRFADCFVRSKESTDHNGAEELKIYLNLAIFRGVLCVKDREAFAKMFSHGLGKAKAFGCGMLQLVPITTDSE